MSTTLFWNVLAILLMMAPGALLRRRNLLGDVAAAQTARVILLVTYPCLMFTAISERYSWAKLVASWRLPAGVFGLVLLGWLGGLLVARLLHFARVEQRRAFLFQCAFNNYSFLALPLVEALWGAEAGAMLLLSTVGAELGIWTIGVSTLSGHAPSWRQAKELAARPPLIALALAMVWIGARDTLALPQALLAWVGGEPGSALFRGLKLVGNATIPLSMLVAGCSLATLPLGELRHRRVWIASALRLVAIPVVALLALRLLPLPPLEGHVLAVVAVMPSAVASITLCKVYGGDEHLTAGTVLLTHLAAIATVPLLLAAGLG